MIGWLISAGAFGLLTGWGWSQMRAADDNDGIDALRRPAAASASPPDRRLVEVEADRAALSARLAAAESDVRQLRARITELEAGADSQDSGGHPARNAVETLSAERDAALDRASEVLRALEDARLDRIAIEASVSELRQAIERTERARSTIRDALSRAQRGYSDLMARYRAVEPLVAEATAKDAEIAALRRRVAELSKAG